MQGESAGNEYDDCEESASMSNSSDNIYCVIEELKLPKAENVSPNKGLLSEIVNEIENRNINSIYSTTRKNTKAGSETTNGLQPPTENTYQNLSQLDVKQPVRDDTISAASSTAQDDSSRNIYQNTKAFASKSTPNNATSTAVNNKAISLAAKPKPTIATKPNINGADNKIVNKESSQKMVAGQPMIKSNSNALRRPNLQPTSNVQALHRKFENANVVAANQNKK